MSLGTSRDSHQDHQEGDQRDVQSRLRDQRQRFPEAVKQVAEEVDNLISHNHMPWLNRTESLCQPGAQNSISAEKRVREFQAYNSG